MRLTYVIVLCLLVGMDAVCAACLSCLDIRRVAEAQEAANRNSANRSQDLTARLYSPSEVLEAIALPANVQLTTEWLVNRSTLVTGALAVQASAAPPTLWLDESSRINSSGKCSEQDIDISVPSHPSLCNHSACDGNHQQVQLSWCFTVLTYSL